MIPTKIPTHELAKAKGMLARGDRQSDVAAYYGVNSGRIAELNAGRIGQGISPAAEGLLPPPGPYLAARSATRARDTLLALRSLIDDCLRDIRDWEEARYHD